MIILIKNSAFGSFQQLCIDVACVYIFKDSSTVGATEFVRGSRLHPFSAAMSLA